MKKKLSYRDKLLELAHIYGVKEIEDYVRSEIKDSSPILWRSSITISAGESDSPSTIKLTAIDDWGTGVEDM